MTRPTNLEPIKLESPAELARMTIGDLELMKEGQRTILRTHHYTAAEPEMARQNMRRMDATLTERGEVPVQPRGAEDHLIY